MRLASRCLMIGLLIGSAAWANAAAATATLKSISVDKLPGGRVELHMNFDNGPVPQPRIFTTDNPPRIAVDFADTVNNASRHIDIGEGSTSGVSAVSAGDRTRVVVELMRDSTYHSAVEGNSLVLTVNNGTEAQPVTTAATIDPSKALPSSMADGTAVSNIDFRRGENGAGRVLITFNGPGANADMQHQGNKLVVSLGHVQLPTNLAQRLDVLDFATPVQSIATKATPNGARMEIAIKGEVDTSSYQTGDQYVIEVAPKKLTASGRANGSDPTQQPVYTGTRATFNFQDVSVRAVLQLVADESGINLVASDTVGGSITLRLNNVPWDQALDVILRAKGLDKRQDGNVIWIAPQKELADYEQGVAEARVKAEDDAPLITTYVPISYGKANDIAKLLTTGSMQSSGGAGGGAGAGGGQHGFLSPRGSVSFDQRTNTLLINDTAEKIEQLRKLIAVLDRPVQQVLIESRVVIASDSFERDLGAQFGISGVRQVGNKSVITGGSIPTVTGSPGEYFSNTPGTTYQTNGLNVSLPASTVAGSIGVGIIGKNFALDLELQAAQTEGRSELVSSPRVITANQQEAVIRQGQEIGYVTYQNSGTGAAGSGTATVAFKDAVLELKVTPTITADNRVYLAINVKKDALASYITVPGSGQVPIINTQEVNTSVLIDNGQTVVLGGIYQVTKTNSVVKVPGLGDIPVLGALFRQTSRINDKAELLIFVTPRILNDSLQ